MRVLLHYILCNASNIIIYYYNSTYNAIYKCIYIIYATYPIPTVKIVLVFVSECMNVRVCMFDVHEGIFQSLAFILADALQA